MDSYLLIYTLMLWCLALLNTNHRKSSVKKQSNTVEVYLLNYMFILCCVVVALLTPTIVGPVSKSLVHSNMNNSNQQQSTSLTTLSDREFLTNHKGLLCVSVTMVTLLVTGIVCRLAIPLATPPDLATNITTGVTPHAMTTWSTTRRRFLYDMLE